MGAKISNATPTQPKVFKLFLNSLPMANDSTCGIFEILKNEILTILYFRFR